MGLHIGNIPSPWLRTHIHSSPILMYLGALVDVAASVLSKKNQLFLDTIFTYRPGPCRCSGSTLTGLYGPSATTRHMLVVLFLRPTLLIEFGSSLSRSTARSTKQLAQPSPSRSARSTCSYVGRLAHYAVDAAVVQAHIFFGPAPGGPRLGFILRYRKKRNREARERRELAPLLSSTA